LVLLAVFAGASSRLIAQAETIGFHDKGTVSTVNFRESTLASTPELNPPLLNLVQWNGLGVVGGTADTIVDPGEAVWFEFDVPAIDVSYYVQFAANENGNGQFGESEVEGYGVDGVWLGTAHVDGVGSKNISAAFAGQALTGVRVRPSERIRIYSLSYNSGAPETIGFHDKGTVSTAKFRASGLTVRPELNPTLLNLVQYNGLGVVGGTLDSAVDPGEAVWFEFDVPAIDVSYYVQFAQDTNGNGQFGESEVEGYGVDGVWLGTAHVDGVGSKNISAAFAGQALTGVRVRPSERIRIYSLSYTPLALPALTCSLADNWIVLSWPTNAADFMLVAASSLNSNAVWNPVGGTVVISNDQNTVSVPATNALEFFRLRR